MLGPLADALAEAITITTAEQTIKPPPGGTRPTVYFAMQVHEGACGRMQWRASVLAQPEQPHGMMSYEGGLPLDKGELAGSSSSCSRAAVATQQLQ